MKEEFRDLMTDNKDIADLLLLGIPFDKNASVGIGASKAPDTLRKLSYFLPAATKDGKDISSFKIYDEGNITYNNESCEEYFSLVKEKATSMLNTNKFVWFVGGDHSVAIPTEQAFYDYAKKMNKTPYIIHIDAHPDICDIYEDSKFSHACPNRRALDYGYKDENIIMIGIRGYEIQEIEFFKKHPNIKVYTASYINENGIDNMLHEITNKIDDNSLVYLSYDIDANDPSFAPGTGTPEAFGLNSLTLLKILTYLIKKLPIQAMDLVEISPLLDINDITSWLGLKTMYEIFALKKEVK